MKIGAFIIPTGVGAEIGGYAGDASIWVRELSKKTKLIVNPNVVNAACFSGITENMQYVEGYILDDFFKGKCGLIEKNKNKIGIIFDKSIPNDVLNIHINTMNAVKVVYGIDICGYEITQNEVGVDFFINNSGESVGNIKNLKTLKDAAESLIKRGCEALAIVCHFPEEQNDDYANGIGVDPVGGVEAIISHYISKEFKIPCAHAPAFSDYSISTKLVNPKCAAEYITPTFLPCILLGLSQAPKPDYKLNGLTVKDLDFIVMPFDSLGCIPVLEMNKLQKNIFVIAENKTVLNVTADKLNIKCRIIKNYQELIDTI